MELVVSNKPMGEEKVSPTVEEIAGAIISLGGMIVLVRPKDGSDKWLLPKGHIEPGEDAVGAAIREAAEEAGVLLAPKADPVHQSTWTEDHDGKEITKHCQWFVGAAEGLRTENMTDNRQIGIFRPLVALARLTYEDQRLALAAVLL